MAHSYPRLLEALTKSAPLEQLRLCRRIGRSHWARIRSRFIPWLDLILFLSLYFTCTLAGLLFLISCSGHWQTPGN